MEKRFLNIFYKKKLSLKATKQMPTKRRQTDYQEKQRALIKAEGNILENPLFYLARGRRPPTMIYSYDVTDRQGEIIGKREINVASIIDPKSGTTIGVPGAFDMDVFMAILRLWVKQKYPDEIVYTDYEIAKELGLNPKSGKARETVRESVLRLKATLYKFKEAFYKNGVYITDAFSLLDNVTFYDKETDLKKGIFPRQARGINRIKLNEKVIQSIERNYYLYIDFNIYTSLPSGLPRRYYTYLRKKGLFDKGSYTEGITKLAKKLPLGNYPISRIKQYLTKALNTLKEQGILRWRFSNDGQKIIHWVPKPIKNPQPKSIPEPNTNGPTEEEYLVKQILEVTGDQENKGWYYLIARSFIKAGAEALIYRAIGETKETGQQGEIRTTRGAYFTYLTKQYAKEQNIEIK